MSEEYDTLYELVQEAHRCIKDMRGLIRESREVGDQLRSVIASEFDEQMHEVAHQAFQHFATAVGDQVEVATQAVFDRFDLIANILLGEVKSSMRKGGGLTDAARLIRDRSPDTESVKSVVDDYFQRAEEAGYDPRRPLG
jgi:BMFP domain-containing protein YqiC